MASDQTNDQSGTTQHLEASLSSEKQTFTITPEYIVHQKGDRRPITWQNKDIVDVKFGRYPLNYGNPIFAGERISISFLSRHGETIHLRYNHHFGSSDAFYDEVTSRIKEYLVKPFAAERYDRVIRGEVVEIGRLRITKTSIAVVDTGLSFAWTDLSIKKYDLYFLLSKLSAPEFKFIIDFDQWNSEVTFQLITSLFENGLGRNANNRTIG